MRIWVARPEPGASRTAARLRDLGHRPLVAPVLDVAETGARLPVGRFAGLILTSANAAAALSPDERARFRDIPAFAVGANTAAAARAAGLGDVRIAGGEARALAALVAASLPRGSVLLHAAGVERKAEPAAVLAEAGFELSVCELYATRIATCLPETLLDALGARALDAALHYSRRSAAAAHDLAGAHGLGGAFRALTHYCLSADVAVPLVAAGVAVHFVPERPDEGTLLAGLAAPKPTGI